MRLMYLVFILITINYTTNQKSFAQQNFKLIYNQDFESPQAINDFEMTDVDAWKISDGDTGKVLELFGKSNYKSSVRSPFNIALIKDVVVGNFVLEVELNQTGKEYGHRDLCLFFGVNSSTNFYYVHIASIADDHANNIFLVNDEPRIKIGTQTTKGTDWGTSNSWHKVRIERDVASGSIKVYFDDHKTPIMEARDVHFLKGSIGIGSFDDTGKFDNLKIWSNTIIEKQLGFFN